MNFRSYQINSNKFSYIIKSKYLMKVLAVVPSIYNKSPGQRYRIEQWEKILKNHGVEIEYAAFESEKLNQTLYKSGNTLKKGSLIISAFLKRFQIVTGASKYDAVYIFREASLIGPAFFEKMIFNKKIPIVYDFDDAIFLPNVSEANARFEFLKVPEKTGDICRMSSQIMVGNRYLAQYASQFNKNITVVPSTIDTDYYLPKTDYNSNSVPIIVWSGSITTLPHLKTLSSALQNLAKREKFILRVIGAADLLLEGVQIENVRWNAATEADDLRQADIGIMPLPNDDWSKGKCGMKALQYMGMGIPTICSAVGANNDIIQDGKNGFLAATEGEWIENLTVLLKNSEMRRELGQQGRKTVEQYYSAKVQAPQVFKVLKKAVEMRKE